MNNISSVFYRTCIYSVLCLYIGLNIISLYVGHYLWDMNVYVRAISDYTQGIDPYRDNVRYLFIYHPYVLKFFVFVNHLFSIKLWLGGFYLFTTVFFIREFLVFCKLNYQPYIEKSRISIFLVLLAAFCFGNAGLVSIKTGNLTIFLHFLLLGLFFNSHRRKSNQVLILFALFVLISSIIKPYFLAYLLLLPYVSRQKRVLYFIPFIITFCLMIWLSALMFDPYLYDSFMNALQHQTFVKGDFGYAIFGLIQRKVGTINGLLIHFGLMFIYLLLVLLYARKFHLSWFSNNFIPLIIIFIILINPRMKVYDFPIAVIFGFFYLWSSKTASLRVLRVFACSLLLSCFPMLFITFNKLGILEPNRTLADTRLFQFIGFLVVLGSIASTALELVKSQSSQKVKLR